MLAGCLWSVLPDSAHAAVCCCMAAICSCPLCCFAHCSSRACNCLLLCTSAGEANRTHKSRQCIHLHPQHLQLHTLAVGLCITPNAHYKLLIAPHPKWERKHPCRKQQAPNYTHKTCNLIATQQTCVYVAAMHAISTMGLYMLTQGPAVQGCVAATPSA